MSGPAVGMDGGADAEGTRPIADSKGLSSMCGPVGKVGDTPGEGSPPPRRDRNGLRSTSGPSDLVGAGCGTPCKGNCTVANCDDRTFCGPIDEISEIGNWKDGRGPGVGTEPPI